jgi:flavodoxin
MKTCVAYYSRSGNTKIAAEYLANKIGATIIVLNDQTDYHGVFGFLKGGMKASFARKAKLNDTIYREISLFERIILATPVWAGKTTPAINAVLSNVDFRGKAVYILTTQADPDCKGSEKRKAFYQKTIEAKKGKFMGLYSLYGSSPGATASSDEMADRIEAIEDIREL